MQVCHTCATQMKHCVFVNAQSPRGPTHMPAGPAVLRVHSQVTQTYFYCACLKLFVPTSRRICVFSKPVPLLPFSLDPAGLSSLTCHQNAPSPEVLCRVPFPTRPRSSSGRAVWHWTRAVLLRGTRLPPVCGVWRFYFFMGIENFIPPPSACSAITVTPNSDRNVGFFVDSLFSVSLVYLPVLVPIT